MSKTPSLLMGPGFVSRKAILHNKPHRLRMDWENVFEIFRYQLGRTLTKAAAGKPAES